jgi:hypothetical protein
LAWGLAVFCGGVEARAHDLVLRGIAIDEQSMEFSLRDEATGEAGWVKLGQSWGNALLMDFDVQTRTLGVKIGGRIERLELPKGMILVMPGEAGATGAAVTSGPLPTASASEAKILARAHAWARTMEPDPVRVLGRKSAGFTPPRPAGTVPGAEPASSTPDGSPAAQRGGGLGESAIISPDLPAPGDELFQVVPRRLISRARS